MLFRSALVSTTTTLVLGRFLAKIDDDAVAKRLVDEKGSAKLQGFMEFSFPGVDHVDERGKILHMMMYVPDCLDRDDGLTNNWHRYGRELLSLNLPEGSKIQKKAKRFVAVFDLFYEIDPVVKQGFVMAPYFDEVEFEAMLRGVLNNSNDLNRSEIVRKSLMRSYNAEFPTTAGGSFVDDEKLRERFGLGVNWVVFRDRKQSIRDVLEKVLVPGSEKKATEPDETSTDEGSDPEPVAHDPKVDAITTDLRERLAVSPEPKVPQHTKIQIDDAKKKSLLYFLLFAEGCTFTQVSMSNSFNDDDHGGNDAYERARFIIEDMDEYARKKFLKPLNTDDSQLFDKVERLYWVFKYWKEDFEPLLKAALESATDETFNTALKNLKKVMTEMLTPNQEGEEDPLEEKEFKELIARNLWIEAKAGAQGCDRCSVNPKDATNPYRVAVQEVTEKFLNDNF